MNLKTYGWTVNDTIIFYLYDIASFSLEVLIRSWSKLLDLANFVSFLAFMTNCHIWVQKSQRLWLPFMPNSRKLVKTCLAFNLHCYTYSIYPHSGSIRVQNVSLDKKCTSGLHSFLFVFLHLWRTAISGFQYLRDYGYPSFPIQAN